jgi:hemolysin activation/secretion protein
MKLSVRNTVRKLIQLGLTVIVSAPHVVNAATDADPAFFITEVRVLGNSVLANADIERVLYEFVGKQSTIKDIERARGQLEQVYRQRGYGTVFVDIPEQEVDGGIVRLQVTEGRLDRVRITGARYFANGQIRDLTPALTQGEVLHLPALQEQLGKVNRQSRDRSVTPVLRAGRTPGTVDVELKVEDEVPVHASLEVNDRYTADTSETRASLNLSYDNLFQRFHSLSFQYQTAPEEPDEARVFAATYVAPVSERGNVLALYAVDTDSEVATIGTLGVIGAGRIFGARFIMPLPSDSGLYHSFTLGGDYKDFDEDVRLEDDQGLRTPIHYANWSAAYGGGFNSTRTTSTFSLAANFGLRGLGNSDEEFENKRFLAQPSYFYLRGDARHERPLIFGTRVALRLAGQYTVEPLISNEQFSIGGFDSVRGYLESEDLGDYGANGSLEWISPLPRLFGDYVQQFLLYSFYDAGIVRIHEALPEQPSGAELASWGAGIRLHAFSDLEAQLDWARALKDSGHVAAGDSRIHFRVRYGF